MNEMAIATSNLVRRFGKLTAVQDLSLEVPQESVYAFLGPNGAGKTTTIRMLLGLIRPHAGEVRLFGETMREHRLGVLRRVGAMVESPSIYPHLTGRENLELVRRLVDGDKARVGWALHLMNLQDAADRRAGTYSAGMKQRLGLALALLNAPELLILDEPTNGLDPAGIREIRDLIRRLPEEEGITVFLSSHLLNEVEMVATHLGIIQQGRLRFQGTMDELHAQMGQYVWVNVDQPQKAKAVLTAAGWSIHRNGDTQLLVAANGYSDVAMINAQLLREGINVFGLNLQRPTLEDIFMAVTETAA